MMLGIVGTVAALVLTFGLAAIFDFNQFLVDVDITENTLKERFIVEFVEFRIDELKVYITVRNIGLNDITIDSISIVNINTQKFILLQTDAAKVVQPKTKLTFPTDDVDSSICTTNFAAPATGCTDASYRITLATGRGNIYSIDVTPLRA